MHATRKVKLKDLSENLTCHLCGGYFIDATTIIECLHSFCRSCIVQHLEKTEFCPQCDVQLHSSKPLSSIRSDQMLQEVVYKLVPGLFQSEMTHRRKYYKEHSELKPKSQQDGGQVNESYITSDDMIHLSLEFDTTDKKLRESTKRYFQCPAAVSIAILKKLVQGKYDLKNTSCIEILYRERYLPDDFLLMDIAYKYSWSHNGSGPLQLYYRVHSVPTPMTFNYRSLYREPITEKSESVEVVRKYQKSISVEKFTPLKKGNKSEKPIPIKSPTGKPRGRPKRKPNISTTEDPVEPVVVDSKKMKLTKGEKIPRKSKPTKIEKQRHEEVPVEGMNHSLGTEVQLRISENGVISAKSISSGEEKIINPLPHQVTSCLPISTSSFTGVCPPSPLGYLEQPVTTNVNHSQSQRCRTPSPVSTNSFQNSPISFKKLKVDNMNASIDTSTKIINGTEKAEKYQWKYSKAFGDEKSSFRSSDSPVIHTPLKVPTPSKWLHQPHVVNGNLKFTTTKASPVKDKLGFTTSIPSPKKPPKFFKSRISDMTSGSNGHSDIPKDIDVNFMKSASLNLTSTDLKVPVPKPRISPPESSAEHDNGIKNFPTSSDGHQSTEKRQSENTTLAHPEPIHPLHHQQMSNQQFPSFGLHVDGNGNMNMGGLPMHFVPSLANSYCSLPFYSNPPNPFLASALAMTMNMNAFSGFPFTNTTPSSTSSNNTSNGSYKHGNSKNSSLDLSTSSKKSKTNSYVQISPKKSSKTETKDSKKGKDSHLAGHTSSTSSTSPAKRNPSPLANPKIRKSTSPVKITSELKTVPLDPPKLSSLVDVIASTIGEGKPESSHPSLVEIKMSEIDPKIGKSSHLNRETTSTDASVFTPHCIRNENKDESSERLLSLVEISSPANGGEPLFGLELIATTAVSESEKTKASSPISAELTKELRESAPPTPTVMATLMVSLDEGEEVSPPGPATISGKSPTTTINNNNIVNSSSDSPETVVSSNIISSSTTTTTSA